MRVIEHRKFQDKQKKRSKKVVSFFFLVLIIASGFFIHNKLNNKYYNQNNAGAVLAEQKKADPRVTPNQPEEFNYFAGDEFTKLYQSIAYPNTQELTRPPDITGNVEADNRIRTIAISRGYKLQSVPVAPITQTKEPGLVADDLLQQKALDGWSQLEKAAKADGIPLKLNSGYRSIEFQRKLFLSRLYATGVTPAQIAVGKADTQVVQTLSKTALPGFSRHHTGYTIDLLCGTAVQAFETTRCFKWLSSNNYLNAKKAGWIPSYPEGSDNQGPEPESWEYVWVSKEAILKK